MATETREAQFEDSPQGWAQRWQFELKAARDAVKGWHKAAADIVRRFLDERDGDLDATAETRLNLFTANIQTQQATLYGNTPRVSVGRRFADSQDDVARVAGDMLERLLNTDLERDNDTYALVLEQCLSDVMLAGLGVARVRYVFEEEPTQGEPAKTAPDGRELAPAVPAIPKRVNEDVETDYVHWDDFLWSPAKVWQDVRWVAFRAQMTRKALVERFGKDVGANVPLNSKRAKPEGEENKEDPWARADVWEIWDKEHRRVFWYVDGHPTVLDSKEDPLELEGFWPCPRPMVANLTTSKFLPRPDYALAQDLYRQIDVLSTRIGLLEESVKVVGAYDAQNTELKQMLGGAENKMVPVDNWALLAEKGGLRGVVDWFPLEMVVSALTSLRDVRQEKKELLYEVTGMSDIMRGAAGAANVTATEQSIKAKFGSVRMQRRQDEFARFASDIQKLRAEVIGKHFAPETIIARSNIEFTPDADKALPAVELLKDKLKRCYRVEVKPETVSLTDFAQLKQERLEVLEAIGAFLQVMGPLAQQMPGALPFMLRMLQQSLAGLRGASQFEAILDQAIAQAEQAAKAAAANPQAKPPDPKLLAQQMKGQQDMQKIQAELQADLVRTQAEVAADAQREENQAMWNTREAAAKQQISAANRAANPEPRGGFPR